jgi:hypothetical protein
MIISRMDGGLGNQMFQYACALSLARQRETRVVLDVSKFHRASGRTSTPRSFALDIFDLPVTLRGVTSVERLALRALRVGSRAPYAGGALARFGVKLFTERQFAFDDSVQRLGRYAYLVGYWQSYRYFASIAELIHRDFSFPSFIDESNRKLSDEMMTGDSIALHVRRGDYLNAAALETHVALGVEYFQAALRHILARVDRPHVYVFSDDPQWVAEHLNIPCRSTIVMHNSGVTAFRDMQLMSHCKHNIIANSTFSWWSAWLNKSPEKVVVAPDRWFAKDSMNACLDDLIPSTWERL